MGASESAIIVAVLALIGNVIGGFLASSKQAAVMHEQITDIKEDINTLSARVDRHNNLVERMAIAESGIKSAHKRMDDAGIGRGAS